MNTPAPYVVTRIFGGLGNQMFQYAVGYRLAKKLKVNLKLDISGYATDPLRKFTLGKLKISGGIATPADLAPFSKRGTKAMFGTLRRFLTGAGVPTPTGYVQEPKFTFNPEILTLTNTPLYLDGYWQSEKYFIDVADDLRKEFCVAAEPTGDNRLMLQRIGSADAVCLHIRRGDYVKNQHTNSVHGTASLEYYYTAIQHIQSIHPRLELFVFSDDVGWVRENLHTTVPTTFVDHNGPDSDYEDLRLMSSCKHHIMANSTFSWWAAWLGERPGQIAIAPKKWFNSADMDSTDLVPARWLRM